MKSAEMAKNGNFIDLKVATNGNYLLYDKWPKMAINGCMLLPKLAIKGTICNSIENLSHFFAISGNILHLHQ